MLSIGKNKHAELPLRFELHDIFHGWRGQVIERPRAERFGREIEGK